MTGNGVRRTHALCESRVQIPPHIYALSLVRQHLREFVGFYCVEILTEARE